eukprot:gene10554-12206_t
MIHARSIPAARVQIRAAYSKPTGVSSRYRSVAVMAAVNTEQLKAAKIELKEVITSKSSNPIIVRLAWHDSGTYNKNISEWPARGGANASIRFKPEISHGCNAGLNSAIDIIEPVKAKFPDVSYSDLFQCFPWRSLEEIFYRMGLDDKEIVALSGGHTLGRARPDRSGWGKAETKYTKDGPGNPGGQSWTPDWLVFNNSYFTVMKAQNEEDLLVLPTDAAIFADEAFKPYAEKYAADEAAFFADYSAAHLKLSELGVEWEEGGPVTGI